MTYKQKICNRIIEKMELLRDAQWADHIDKHTKDAVITVMENVVDGIANSRQAKYEEDADGWISCSKRMPREDGIYLVTNHKGEVVRYVFYNTNESREYWHRCVVAWMPMPKAYKGA